MSLIVGGLMGTTPVQAAPSGDRAASTTTQTVRTSAVGAEHKLEVAATSPSISPAAKRIRYVTDGSYSCSYGTLCLRVWDPTRGKYKVFDLYYCNTYHLSYWGSGGDGGGFYNNQTTGTVATFYNSTGGVYHSSTAYSVAPSWFSWDPVWTVKNC
ncbi:MULTISPECIES: hypothetical protein [unclassified Streptomyces]|uniref:hypothetical protein n=1 Tax=unclassified Streptomyces TaxID=2593676 RepID=UPI0022B6EA01|nr:MULTISPECIES: hypothetical protein [unclassified Streptomyces]MCZ7412933.1 hypothetical protein [Streptomyces sp. WMMC897]MCZ7434759.1 hypothetical protein [Streptomyces sp. WMMC1477]